MDIKSLQGLAIICTNRQNNALTEYLAYEMAKLKSKCFTLIKKDLQAVETLDEKIFLDKGIDLSRHIENTYTHEEGLKDNLRIIQHYLQTHESGDNLVEGIIEKLREEVDACTPGFHNRVNSILWMLYRPLTIEDFLTLIRQGIVESVAHQRTDEVHLHNTFFNHAYGLGFGVAPINSSDAHAREELSNKNDINALETAIKEHYTAWSILNDLLINIEEELRASYNYKGLQLEGYDYPIYNAIFTFFETMLADKELRYESIFHYDDEIIKVTDINWHAIQIKLWETLKNKDYLRFELEEERFYKKLLSRNEEDFQEDAELIKNIKLHRYPYLIKYITEAQQQRIIPFIFDSIEFSREDESFFKTLAFFNEFEEDSDKRIHFIKPR